MMNESDSVHMSLLLLHVLNMVFNMCCALNVSYMTLATDLQHSICNCNVCTDSIIWVFGMQSTSAVCTMSMLYTYNWDQAAETRNLQCSHTCNKLCKTSNNNCCCLHQKSLNECNFPGSDWTLLVIAFCLIGLQYLRWDLCTQILKGYLLHSVKKN